MSVPMEYEQEVLGPADYLAILRRRRKQLILPALIVLAISIGLALLLPPVYESEATILIEQQEVPPDLVRSTVTSYAGERIQVISQRVMTTQNLSRIIERYGLYPKERERDGISTAVEEMRDDVTLEMISADVVDPRSGRPTTATIAFKLGYSYSDPRIAQKVANELVSLFLNENLKQRTESAAETSSFLAQEAERLHEEVRRLEGKLADFKQHHINSLPEMQQLNLQLLERAERDLKDTDSNIRALEERAVFLRSELARMSPTSDLYSADGKRVLSTSDRLKALQTQRIELLSRYSPTHPDVLKTEREIAALRQETGVGSDVHELQRKVEDLRGELASLRKRYSAAHPDVRKLQRTLAAAEAELKKARQQQRKRASQALSVQSDNPAYIDLQARLRAAELELESTRRTRQTIKEKISELEQRLMDSPQVERDYRDLMRNYENAQTHYREVKAKQMEAELGTSLERENKGERFSLLEPPVVPEKPVKPNRLAILVLGVILAGGTGLGTVAVSEALDDKVSSPKELVNITRSPPLVVIPYIETEEELSRQRATRRKLVVASLVLIAAAIAGFHFLVMPLDVLWYVVLRKLGISQ